MTKEQLARELPGMIEGLRAELRVAQDKHAHCLVMGISEHERTYLGQIAMLRWRLDRAWDALQDLPLLTHETGRDVDSCLESFGAHAAAMWWAAEESRRRGWFILPPSAVVKFDNPGVTICV